MIGLVLGILSLRCEHFACFCSYRGTRSAWNIDVYLYISTVVVLFSSLTTAGIPSMFHRWPSYLHSVIIQKLLTLSFSFWVLLVLNSQAGNSIIRNGRTLRVPRVILPLQIIKPKPRWLNILNWNLNVPKVILNCQDLPHYSNAVIHLTQF